MAKTGYDDEFKRRQAADAAANQRYTATLSAMNQQPDGVQAAQGQNMVLQQPTTPVTRQQAGAATVPAAAMQQARQAAVNSVMGQPATYDAYGALADKKMQEVQNTKGFSYNFNADPMFKMLSNSYMNQARQAANNASAMAAARTGGYGNSYGAMAAGQQYNQALQNLYDQVPELQQAAYERYLNDRNDLYKQADYYANRGDTMYNRDFNERQYADSRKDVDWEHDFQNRKYNDSRGDVAWEQGMQERKYGDSRADVDWEHNFQNRQYDDTRGDVAWEQGLQERQYNDSRADAASDRAFRDRQYDDSRADVAADRDFRDQQYADSRADAASDRDFRERQYGDSRRDYEDETAYARAQDAYNRQRAEEQTDYDRAQDAYNRQRAEEETAYDRYTDEYNRRNAMAQYLASLGNYEAAEALSGYDLNQARRTDDLNMALQIIGAVGYDKALPLIQQLLGVNGLSALVGSSSSGGSSGGGKSSGRASSGGTTTAAAPTVTQTPAANVTKPVPSVVELTDEELMRALRGY